MPNEKRTISVTFKVSEADLKLFANAAAAIWPRAVLTRSGIILGLARLGAEQAMKKKSRS